MVTDVSVVDAVHAGEGHGDGPGGHVCTAVWPTVVVKHFVMRDKQLPRKKSTRLLQDADCANECFNEEGRGFRAYNVCPRGAADECGHVSRNGEPLS